MINNCTSFATKILKLLTLLTQIAETDSSSNAQLFGSKKVPKMPDCGTNLIGTLLSRCFRNLDTVAVRNHPAVVVERTKTIEFLASC